MRTSLTRTPSGTRLKGSSHALLGLVLTSLAAACSGGAPATNAPTSSATSSPTSPTATPALAATPTSATATPSGLSSEGPSPSGAPTGFPVSITDDEGTRIDIDAEPERIISLSPANTELVFALGAGERLVGGTDFDDFPAEAARLDDVVVETRVLIERIVEAEPDLVLAAGNAFTPSADIDRMRGLGLDVMVVYASDVDAVLADIELIGTAIGRSEEAVAITDAMTARIDAVTSAAAAIGEHPRVFYQLGSEPEIFGPAPDSFIADMVVLAGGDPITTTDPSVFAIPVERLVEEDPEVIIVGDAAYGVCPADVAARPAWRQMTAVMEGAVRPIDDLIVTRPGPRLGDGLAALAVAIHPDLMLSPAPPAVPYCRP